MLGRFGWGEEGIPGEEREEHLLRHGYLEQYGVFRDWK